MGTYVVMPDHVHLFVTPSADAVLLANWVRYWKSQFTRKHGDLNKGWQSDYWDRTLRSNESYAEKRDYVLNNPVRKGLVIRAEDWPYRGDLNELLW